MLLYILLGILLGIIYRVFCEIRNRKKTDIKEENYIETTRWEALKVSAPKLKELETWWENKDLPSIQVSNPRIGLPVFQFPPDTDEETIRKFKERYLRAYKENVMMYSNTQTMYSQLRQQGRDYEWDS